MPVSCRGFDLSKASYKRVMEAVQILTHYLLLYPRYNGCTREAYFSVGLQGIAEKDIQTVQDLVDRTLDDIIEYVRCLWGWAGVSPPECRGHFTSQNTYSFMGAALFRNMDFFSTSEFLVFL